MGKYWYIYNSFNKIYHLSITSKPIEMILKISGLFTHLCQSLTPLTTNKIFEELSNDANWPLVKSASKKNNFLFLWTNTYVVGTQKNGSFEHPKHMLNWWVRKYLQFYAKNFCLLTYMGLDVGKPDCCMPTTLGQTSLHSLISTFVSNQT